MARIGSRAQPLAIIGMACRFPGAEDIDAYWRSVRGGVSSIGVLPKDHLDRELYYDPRSPVPGKCYSELGGIVPARPFDPASCPLTEELQATADPSHLTMLEVAAAACRHAGFDPFAFPLKQSGVFIGNGRASLLPNELAYANQVEEMLRGLEQVDEFNRLSPDQRKRILQNVVDRVRQEKPGARAFEKLDAFPNAGVALISEVLGLTGPYMAVNAACASSFYALSIAARALHTGRVDLAIVGGASCPSWQNLVWFSQASALSAKGSFPFDSRADGFVPSGGYAAILMKTLSRALRDGDTIHGVVRGIGLSSDGRGKSLWAPRKEGQIEAICRAYAGGLEPERVQYIEAHGTSTAVGDATEIESLVSAFGENIQPGTRIPVASVKANIGHTLEAAGLAGLLKTLLAMRHGVIPAAINYETPNPRIAWDRVPFFVPRSEIEWLPHQDGHPRRAAIDSFGIGGLNSHLVVDDFVTQSAKTFVGRAPETVDTADRSVEEKDTIAVIGLGAIFPGARTAEDYWELLQSARDPKCEAPPDRWNPLDLLPERSNHDGERPRGGFVTDFVFRGEEHRIPPKQVKAADALQFMVLDAVQQALKDAAYVDRPFDRRRVAVVVGTIFSGDFLNNMSLALHLPELKRDIERSLEQQGLSAALRQGIPNALGEVVLGRSSVLEDESGSHSTSTLASRVVRTFDLMGGAFAVDAGEASSIAALSTAVDLLHSGECDMVLCVGAQLAADRSMYERLRLRGYLSSGRPGAAFDGDADGFLPADGSGALLLKRTKDARADGDRIRALIRGVGSWTDSRSPGTALRQAIETSFTRTGVGPKDVSVVEAAGVGIPLLDDGEVSALAETYASAERSEPLWVGSVAGQIGHALGASGMASMIKMILALDRGELPANVPLRMPSESMTRMSRTLRRVAESQPIRNRTTDTPPVVGVSSFAFRGLAYHVLLEAPPRVAPLREGDTTEWRIVRMGAPTMAELLERISRSQHDSESLFARAHATSFSSVDRARLGMVACRADEVAEQLELAARCIADPKARHLLADRGVFYCTSVPENPRVAFVFSGQGSQYDGMLRSLTKEVGAASDMLSKIDDTMAELGLESFADLAWTSDSGLGVDVWRTQASILLADTIVHAAVTSLGIEPDVVCGHSYGEYPALVAAGAWSLQTAIRVTRRRCEEIEASRRSQGCMMSTTAGSDTIQGLLLSVDGAVYVANDNAPDQTVVGGERAAVASLERLLAAEGFENQLLPVPRPYHTPLMEEVREPLRTILQGERILPPRIPVLSGATNRYVADPHTIRTNLVQQLVEPLRYVAMIERLVEDGVEAIVEVGPRHVLTGLHRRILPVSDVLLVGSDHPKRRYDEQLWRVRAALDCVGALDEHRKTSTAPTQSVHASTAVKTLHFDATTRRKEKAQKAAGNVSVVPVTSSPKPAAQSLSDLETWLIEFVCEQTGFPSNLVGLDADLEADLGIDSIKRVQLVGELSEEFDFDRGADSLASGEFSTLRDVANLAQGVARKNRDPSKSDLESSWSPVDDDGRGRVMRRWSLRTELTSIRGIPQGIPQLSGSAVLLGDNPTAHALRVRLEEAGEKVLHLPATQESDSALIILERWWQEVGPAPHLFVMTPCDVEALVTSGVDDWADRRLPALEFGYRVIQCWMQLVDRERLVESATAMVVTRLGGDFGFASSSVVSPEGGGWSGLFKSLPKEYEGLFVKVLDVGCGESTEKIVGALLSELASRTPPVEVAYVRGLRHVVRAVDLPVNGRREEAFPRGGTWVVTGGARGITAYVAREIGRRYGLRMHLLGTSPMPESGVIERSGGDDPRALRRSVIEKARQRNDDPEVAWRKVEKELEIARNLRAFEEDGVQATYHSIDVSDREAMSALLEDIRRSSGAIRGVLHGAGVEAAARFSRKRTEKVHATLCSKVGGAVNLMALTREDPLDFFVGFASVSGRFGGRGQTDYALASDLLCKLVHWFRNERPSCASVAIHWPAWDEMGMAQRPESKAALEMEGQTFLSPQEGVEHLIDELLMWAPEGEVLILDRSGHLDRDGTIPLPEDPTQGKHRHVALIEAVHEAHAERLVARVSFDPATDPFLREHRYGDVPLLPAVIGLESLAEAAQVLAEDRVVVALRDVEIVKGLLFPNDRPQEVRVEIERHRDQALAELYRLDRLHVRGVVELAKEPVALDSPNDLPSAHWEEVRYRDEQQAKEQGRVFHGAALRCLKRIAIRTDGVLGQIVAPPSTELEGDLRSGFVIPAAVLDSCLVAIGKFANRQLGKFQLPHSFGRIRLGRSPVAGETCTVRVLFRSEEDDALVFDFILFGEDGKAIVIVDGYRTQ